MSKGLKYISPKQKAVRIEQDKEKPVEKKILAQAIVDISKAAKALSESGLNRKAIVVLVSRKAGVGMGEVEDVLSALEHLTKEYTNLR